MGPKKIIQPTCHPDDYRGQREKLGLTQAELAAALGVSRATVSRRETGEQPIHAEASLALIHLCQNWPFFRKIYKPKSDFKDAGVTEK